MYQVFSLVVLVVLEYELQGGLGRYYVPNHSQVLASYRVVHI
jgi:hypothetical protein